ncbi:hypothetical protein L596_017760 [Steinernema carpocapsae]|uniref:C-type lectin domain-containing protein n=1 Tax=Steinernema carpocapsae TaxID=34508 RepID=A0A4U5N2Z3_STECR|nr:hypothetical protein L596_017760 [Steinernema carpocapsae]
MHRCRITTTYMKVVLYNNKTGICNGYGTIKNVGTLPVAEQDTIQAFYLNRGESVDCKADVLKELKSKEECKDGWFRVAVPGFNVSCYYVMQADEYRKNRTISSAHDIEHSCFILYNTTRSASIHSRAEELLIASDANIYAKGWNGLILGFCPDGSPAYNWTLWTDGSKYDYNNWSKNQAALTYNCSGCSMSPVLTLGYKPGKTS